MAGATPLKGICVNSMPATCANSTPARWLVVPEPFDP